MRRPWLAALFVLSLLVPSLAQAERPCVSDALDQRVCLAEPAQRVVSLSPGATELLFSAGAGDRVVAVSAWSDYPAESADLPQVGDSNRLDLEAIVSLAPDLVVAWVDGNSRSQLERLSDLGIHVFWLAPRTFDDIAAAVSDLALLTGLPDLGNERAEAFRAEMAALEAQYADVRPVKVFYQIWEQPLMTVNREELISKAISLCGGVNVFGDLPRLVPRISREAVLEANPEAIITAGSSDDRQWLEAWREFPGLAAVAADNLFLEPPDLLARPTLRMADGARHLCQTLEQARANL
ncbi:iron complex transport system substrate-binding protein [Marinobacter sp. 3-2]|jgi:iron complex transport system substrate-binding protein|uniref:cobalamin-binding protein n=1 Tax=Marinobacter sp. 3-2 TaxID=2485141 RepID=UPI000D3BF384|nr:cobalamin-binding protein [Marinobacter sp. 3-2]MCR9188191.1 cobalamin-binding protein [Alteromonadaceae bacterium]ROQ44398.1 iron complex transport system substrate-binding protein [Marinobacter sp. 3-2]